MYYNPSSRRSGERTAGMQSRFLFISRFFLAAVVIAALIGITGATSVSASSDNDNNDDWNDNEPSCWISASPSSVSNGGSTTLSWGSTDADSGWISDIGDVDLSGSRTVSNINTTTTFTFTVNGNGHSDTCQTTVTVSGSGSGSGYGSPSCSIYPSQNNVQSGQSVSLNWTSLNAQSASISVDGSVSLNGSRTVYPTYTTTYTLTVYGYNNQINQCQTTVYVSGTGGCNNNYDNNYNYPYCNYQQAPSCTISLSNYTYQSDAYNRTAQLSWRSYNATSAFISGLGSVAVNGAQAVSYPNANYTLTVSGPGGTATCHTSGNYTYPNYNYPTYPQYQNPYVYLTQIPYTGIDLGPVGTAVYFLALAMFAIAGGYLVVYYNGGVLRFSFAHEVKVAMRNQARTIRSMISR